MVHLQDFSDSDDDQVVFAEIENYNREKSTLQSRVDLASTSNNNDLEFTNEHITRVGQLLGEEGILFFVAGIRALSYYGAKLILSDCVLAVPKELHSKAVRLLSCHPDFLSLGLNESWVITGPSMKYPSFKVLGVKSTLTLVPDVAWGLHCVPSNIHVDGVTLVPYPTLTHLAQSLLRTRDMNKLELLVDGQDSDMEWGWHNLHFGNHSWKRKAWEKVVSEKAKRIPWEKNSDFYATRFRRKKLNI